MKGVRGVRGGRGGGSVGKVDEEGRVLVLKTFFELHGGEEGTNRGGGGGASGRGVSSQVGSTRGVLSGWGIWGVRVGHGWMSPPVR